jgi:multiple sugar transport system substrate-binding protein
MTTTTRVIVTGLVAGGLFLTACGGNGGQGSGDDGSRALKIWTIEDVADRVEAQRRILADFTEATGVKTELVAVAEDQFNQTLTSAAAADDLPDVIGALSLAGVRDMAANELLNTDVAGGRTGHGGQRTAEHGRTRPGRRVARRGHLF